MGYHTQGYWIKIQHLYIFFTLNSEITEDPPLFSITCRTQGGPATSVVWTENHVQLNSINENKSQVIVDTSHNCIYESILHVRGLRRGNIYCSISSNVRTYLPQTPATVIQQSISIKGIYCTLTHIQMGLHLFSTVAEAPTRLTAVISESNSASVKNIIVSWKSPCDPVTGYVIYYQSNGGTVISDRVSGGETETHSLDGLQRGVTYYISIVALSRHLPSPLVGPVNVTSNPPISLSRYHIHKLLSH